MKKKIYTIMENLKNKEFKVIRVNKKEFELDNGDVYPHTFELDENISIEEFQKLLDQSQQTMISHLQKLSDNK
jgi:predicted CoA-binding protein